MTDRNSESHGNQIIAKQAYLRDHIPQQKYEDFAQFCETITKSIDIQSWSFEYVRQLVEKFKRNEHEKSKNKKNTGQSFHLYQTGNANQIKNVAQKLKQQRQEKNGKQQKISTHKIEVKSKNNQPDKFKQEQSALQVLDSIFENHHVSEYQTKKYDKAFFQSCKFWQVPAQQQRQNKQRSPTQNKSSPHNQVAKFTSNSFPIEPQNFQKMFQTGLNLPEQKKQMKQGTPQKKVFVQIPIDDEPIKNQGNKQQSKGKMSKNNKNISSDQSHNQKKPEIKLVSVKNIKTSKVGKIPYEGQILINQHFKDTVACFKSFIRHALSVKNLKIQIIDHQIINRSFFSSNYPMFHLKVHPANIICKRNFQDFQKLQRNLQSVYPGVRLPYLQKLRWLQSQVSPQYIAKQKKYLTYFLEDVMQHQDLKNSRILEDFLTLKDHKQMKRKFEQYDKIKKITSIQELCLLEGDVKVEISETNRQYNQFFQSFLSKMKTFWNNQQRILSQISQMHIKLSEHYKSLHELIEQINKQTKQFNKRVHINQIQCLQDAFQNLTNYVAENIKVNEKQSQFLQNQVLVYLKYQKQNMNMFDPVISNQNNLTKCYLKRRQPQKSNDNLQFLSQRLKDYKVDILEQSKNITVLKYQCGYINNLVANQGYRYFKHLSAKLQKLISDICYSKLDYLSKSINTYTTLVYS